MRAAVSSCPAGREPAAAAGRLREAAAGVGETGAEFLKKVCETEELKKRLRESSGKLRELAAKLARNG